MGAEEDNQERTDDRTTRSASVFLSHDSSDARVAKAFDDLIRDCSGGFVRIFRSTDQIGSAGIDYGTEWYEAIMGKLDSATDVVALLTRNSMNRPWILYEVGVAKGKLNTPVLGLALGIPLSEASQGPFSQFMNCGDDEESLTGLVMQLIRRGGGSPREENVRQHVARFKSAIEEHLQPQAEDGETSAPTDYAAIAARQFEEIKAMLQHGARSLPGRAVSTDEFLSLLGDLKNLDITQWQTTLKFLIQRCSRRTLRALLTLQAERIVNALSHDVSEALFVRLAAEVRDLLLQNEDAWVAADQLVIRELTSMIDDWMGSV